GSEVRAILRDQDARLWVGMNGGGLFFRDGTAWKSPPDQAGPPLRRVLAMRLGANGDLWIGSAGNGLYRWRKDTLFHFDSDVNGLPHTIGSLVEDRSGSLWMGSTEGIYRVRLSDLSALAAGQQAAIVSSRFTKADGMGSTECSVGTGPGIAEGPDGRLWFATRKGITAVDPQALPEASSPPPVFVEEALLWGDHDHDAGHARPLVAKPGGPQPLRAGADTRLVEIHYTAPGFTAPERVRFRYRLDGGDFGWSDAGTRRVAYFQGLAPGSYRFHVTARSHDSEWNPLEGVFEFTIDPHFWQTWWFNLLVTVAVGLLLLLIYRLRVAKIEAVNRLRVRLAGDLHDEIGANLGSIGLNAELMRQDVELSARQQEELGSLQRLAVQTAQSLRDLVWFTNPDFDNTGDMLLRMRDVAALLLAGRTWKFEGEAVMPNRVLDPEFRRNVFFVCKEALHNIAKHSGAQGVQIEFHELGEGIEIKIEDNGRGLPPTVANPGNGLKSMRRRAGALGGTLDIRSENGKGVSLLLKVPYRKSPVGWFSWTPENSGDEKIR
ncbi:MAG TPA: triple tyrosine motif-containing protein, partial [Candidatus Limnocylindria bacterium]|nr:triple tyrosine motif-containing protein [Candidatus Limnocylindria bacterium]